MQARPSRPRRFALIIGFATCSAVACALLIPSKRYNPVATSSLRRARNVDTVRRALAMGADPNATDRDPRTQTRGFRKTAETLSLTLQSLCFYNPIEAEAARRELRDAPPSVLDRHVFLNDPEPVRALLEAGANPNRPGPGGATPLHRAFQFPGPHDVPDGRRRRLEIINLLIVSGADVNTADAHGRTPLMVAAYSGADVTVISRLLKAGADPTRRMRTGATAADLLPTPADPEVVKILTEAKTRD